MHTYINLPIRRKFAYPKSMKKVTLPAFVILLVALAAGLGFVVSRTTDLPTVEEFTKDLQKANNALEPSDQVSRDVMPYAPQYTEINGHKIYYVSGGTSDDNSAMIFLHGNPTQSYMWRHTLPYVEQVSAFYAFDWPGYGYSDKPSPPLNYEGFYNVLSDFIDQQNLEKVVLVIHDFSSMLAFHYAAQNPERIKGIVFMESLVPPVLPIKSTQDLGRAGQFFQNIRHPDFKQNMIIDGNGFVELFVQTGTVNGLTPEAEKVYRAPFENKQNRHVLLVFPNLLPIGGKPNTMDLRTKAYAKWFLNSHDIPKLFLYGEPGLFNKPALVEYYKKNTPEVTSVNVGKGYHYLPEEHGDAIGQAITQWYTANFN